MRPNSKKPGKQRLYEYEISKHEAHKLMSAPLSKKLQEEKGFRTLPVRKGDEVKVVRGNHKGTTGKVNKTDPQKQYVYVDGIINKTTDATEIPVPIHPSNLVITDYYEKDEKRLELINRRIEDEEKKIDIESVLAQAEEEEEDLIEFDDEDFEDEDLLLEDEYLDDDIEDEFALVDEDIDDEFELVDEEIDEEFSEEEEQ